MRETLISIYKNDSYRFSLDWIQIHPKVPSVFRKVYVHKLRLFLVFTIYKNKIVASRLSNLLKGPLSSIILRLCLCPEDYGLSSRRVL